MMMNPASLEAEFAVVRVQALRPRGSKPHWGPQDQARRGHAARALKKAKRNVNPSVALEALGGDGVEVPATLVAATATLPKKVQSRRAFDARAKYRDKKIMKSSVALEGYSGLKVAVLHAVDVMIEALKVSKGGLAESKDQPELGYSRGSRGNASGSGGQDAVQQPGLSELIAKLARPAVDPRGSAGVVHTTP